MYATGWRRSLLVACLLVSAKTFWYLDMHKHANKMPPKMTYSFGVKKKNIFWGSPVVLHLRLYIVLCRWRTRKCSTNTYTQT
ncbi:hypothetical protein LZ31DRAFT_16771 [Colletotrichum somersetense]|nr:hypothetical protein LZ31DRAFT_16771 [Colletotrichum somersetense]